MTDGRFIIRLPHTGHGHGGSPTMWYGGEYTPHSVRIVTIPEAAFRFDNVTDARKCAQMLTELGQAENPVVERVRRRHHD